MDSFEYLVALFSVVAALGLARALSGTAKLVQLRFEVSVSWIHLLWAANIVVWLVMFWWFSFALSEVKLWNAPLLFFVLTYGALIYFLLALLFPDRIPPGTDLFDYLARNRQWFFGGLLALGLMDIADSIIKSNVTEFGGPPIIQYLIFMSIWILPSGVAIFTQNRMFHAVYAVSFFLALVFYNWTILFEIQL